MSQSQSNHSRKVSQWRGVRELALLDTDIGDDIDDALALALALRSPEIDLLGVTTVFGDTQLRARLAKRVLRVFGREEVPVAAGMPMPLQLRHRPSGAPQAAILDPHEHYELSALRGPEFIVEQALAHPGRLTLICIGPLTNIAAALKLEPRLFLLIRRVVMMGGTSSIPFPEWNMRSDALAAQIVLAAGIPVTLIGFNITRRCHLLPADLERLAADCSPQARLLSQLIRVWQRHRPRWQPRSPYLHDPLAVAALCRPDFFRFEEMTARVLVQGPLQGFMVPRALNGPPVQAAVDVQANEARNWIMRRLLANEAAESFR